MSVIKGLMTAEEFRLLPDDGKLKELVRGRVVEVSVPSPQHGYYCGNIVGALREHVRAKKLGRVMSNDSGVVTERGPDSVRGADVCFYSFTRLGPGPIPDGYLAVVPELVFEVKSRSDRWSKITAKVGEYQAAGVLIVCVLDPATATLVVYREDEFPRHLEGDDEFTLPDILGDFRATVRSFFE